MSDLSPAAGQSPGHTLWTHLLRPLPAQLPAYPASVSNRPQGSVLEGVSTFEHFSQKVGSGLRLCGSDSVCCDRGLILCFIVYLYHNLVILCPVHSEPVSKGVPGCSYSDECVQVLSVCFCMQFCFDCFLCYF